MKGTQEAAVLLAIPGAPSDTPTWQRWLTIIGIHLAGVLLWEVVVRTFAIQSFILPAPSRILATLSNPNFSWLKNTGVTALEVYGGYTLGLLLGILCALLFITSRRLMVLVFPVLVTLNMIPKVALGPLIIVWFSYGIGPNILITFSLCFFPILLTTIRGLNETEPELLDLVRALKGSRWQLFRYIQLPKLRGVLMIAVLLRFMDSFMIYTEPFVLTGGGPGNATTFLSQYLTQKAVGQFDLGPAAAFSLIYFLIILLLCFILYNWMQRLGTPGRADK